MHISNLYTAYHSLEEVFLVGKEVQLSDKMCNLMGFYRSGDRLHLVLLEYDQERVIYNREMEDNAPDTTQCMTNRQEEYTHQAKIFHSLIETVCEVEVDGTSYQVESGESCMCEMETTLLFSRFFAAGWQPKGLGEIDFEDVSISALTLEGKFVEIPKWKDNPTIILKQRDTCEQTLIELPITLEIGKDYGEKIYYQTAKSEESHWFMIHDVSMVDMFAEMMAQLEKPKFKEQIPPKEFKKLRAQAVKNMSETCPKGAGFFAVEYECDTNQQLVFHSQHYLESAPIKRNASTICLAKSSKKTGKLGQDLKVCIVKDAVDLDTKAMKAELFSAYEKIIHENIVFTD